MSQNTTSDDRTKLSKKLCTALALVPEDIPEKARGAKLIRRTLSNLAQITQGIAELRGLYGSDHGRDARHTGLEPRHAQLAAASAIAFVDFATETYFKRSDDKKIVAKFDRNDCARSAPFLQLMSVAPLWYLFNHQLFCVVINIRSKDISG
jgi:hypothetical protein